ncbi:hypothetical protein ACUOFC_61485, partial [Escherichia sp. TWPC-MK]
RNIERVSQRLPAVTDADTASVMHFFRVQQVSTSRGMITDRSGRPLAVSVPVKAIWADPKEVHDAGGILSALASAFQRSPTLIPP